mmetsp:Transcript_24346/g.65105  ORF Transcript_24346/g.65105 Transcript_24346/m.65105 type:complete len:138 (+) Transcript_24346:74-487(+)
MPLGSSLDNMLRELEANFSVTDHEELDVMCLVKSKRTAAPHSVQVQSPAVSEDNIGFVASTPYTTHPSAENLYNGDCDAPASRPQWGNGHLVAIADGGTTATARFAGGGSDDVPTAVSAGPAVERGGHGVWEVRFDK